LPHEFNLTVDEVETRIARRIGSQGLYLVARLPKGRVAGLVTATVGGLERMQHAAKLEVLVDANCRGQGIGRALMEACCAWADAEPSIEKLSLSVFADNEPAIGLYQSLGFLEEGRRLREYRMSDGSYRDDVLMYRFCV
jgi:ribosomal protein S18 acetylase RimI-like enzyme